MTDQATKPTPEQAKALMTVSMPSFELLLDHATSLKGECDKAGAMTPERAALFDAYRDALVAKRGEYEDAVAAFICDKFTAAEVASATAFFSSDAHKVVEKFLGFSADINNLGTLWQTRTLENCPDVWKMLMENVGEWQEKNTPEHCEVIVPDAPPMRGAGGNGDGGWKRVDLNAPKAAEELPPTG